MKSVLAILSAGLLTMFSAHYLVLAWTAERSGGSPDFYIVFGLLAFFAGIGNGIVAAMDD